MASELTPEAIAKMRADAIDVLDANGMHFFGSSGPTAYDVLRLLDAAERCAAAEAQAKAAGELLRAAKAYMDHANVTGVGPACPNQEVELTQFASLHDSLREAIEAAERAGVKP